MFKKMLSFLLEIALLVTPLAAFADNSGVWMTLQYKMGGADGEYYLPEAYYAAPIVKDLNKDGRKEIIFGNYSLSVLDAATGNLLWKVNGGKDRQTPYQIGQDIGILCDLEVKDIDADGYDEIICTHAHGLVSVLSCDGYMKYGWPKQLAGENGTVYDSARSLEVSDLNNDGTYEIIVGASTAASENVWVYDAWGNLLSGWPQLASDQDAVDTHDIKSGYSYGVFMDGVTAGDINGDGLKEVLVATDTGYLCAYDMWGKLVPANEAVFGGRTWGKVALWEDVNTENNMDFNEGWGWGVTGSESRSELYKGELGHSVVKVCDVDNDGNNEVVTSAVVLDRYHDCDTWSGDYVASRYMSLFIFNGDRTRYDGWSRSPSDMDFMGAPLIQNPATLSSSVQAEPVICDLNNDGINEVLLNTYDGCVHAFSVNNPRSEFANFPYRIARQSGIAETASGIVCKDIDGDGNQEVIFASFTDTEAHDASHGVKGKVYILNSTGTALAVADLPDGYQIFETKQPAYTNTVLARAAVEDIDNDGVYEIVLNTRYAGICVYKIAQSTVSTTATPTEATLLVNGTQMKVDSYSINGYNYFKLRDVAMMVNGTTKQFNVGYDTASGTVKIIPNAAYAPVGGELSQGDGQTRYVKQSSSAIMNQNALATYIPYEINGNNYFKLRDICNMTGMTVDWDGAANSISLSSN